MAMSEETLVILSSSDSKPEIAHAWDACTGTCLMTYKGEGVANRHGIAVGSHLFTASKNKAQLFAYPLNNQQSINKRFVALGPINAVSISKHGYLALSVKQKMFVYHLKSGALLGFGESHFQNVYIIKFSYDGRLIACGGQDGFITIYCLTDFLSYQKATEPRHKISSHSVSIIGLEFSNLKLFSCSSDKTLGMFDLVTESKSVSIGLEKTPSCFTVVDSIYVGFIDGSVSEIEFSSVIGLSGVIASSNITLHDQCVTDMTHSPDRQLLISSSLDMTIKIWHIYYKNIVKTIKTKTPVVNILCFQTHKSTFLTSKSNDYIQEFKNNYEELEMDLSNRIDLPDPSECHNITVQKILPKVNKSKNKRKRPKHHA